MSRDGGCAIPVARPRRRKAAGSLGARWPRFSDRRLCRLSVVVVVTSFLATVAPISPAVASYPTCVGNYGNLMVGWSTNYSYASQPRVFEGASAQMKYSYGNICTSYPDYHHNFSTAWTMISSGGSVHGWAQSGNILHYGDSCWHHWAEQEENYPAIQPFDVNGACINVGESHRAWQQAVYPGGQWAMRSNIDTTIFIQSSFDPFSSWAGTWNVSYEGETSFDESDVPGYQQAGLPPPTNFGLMEVQDFYNDNYYDTCGNAVLAASPAVHRYATDAPACDFTRVWTSG